MKALRSIMDYDDYFEDHDAVRLAIASTMRWSASSTTMSARSAALDAAGLTETTRVIYTSDHGENLGCRGLWGKSVMYEELAAVPFIVAGPDVAQAAWSTRRCRWSTATAPSSRRWAVRRSRRISPCRRSPSGPSGDTNDLSSSPAAAGSVTWVAWSLLAVAAGRRRQTGRSPRACPAVARLSWSCSPRRGCGAPRRPGHRRRRGAAAQARPPRRRFRRLTPGPPVQG